MKKKFVGIFILLILCVLTFLHSGFKEPLEESDLRLENVEVLSSREGSSGGCVADAGFCWMGGSIQSGMRQK